MKRYVLPLVAALSLLFSVSWTLAERPVRHSDGASVAAAGGACRAKGGRGGPGRTRH